MINNKQVNIWRGDSEPPTIYHVWIYNNVKMLLYNGVEWVIFLSNAELLEKIIELTEKIDIFDTSIQVIQNDIETLEKNTINNIPITNETIILGSDIKSNSSGNYIKLNQTIAESLIKLDALLTTQIIK